MRDPARIPVMLAALGELWAKNPDWRLGQLLVNAANRPDLGRSLFYVEDDVLLRGIVALDVRAATQADRDQHNAGEQHGDPGSEADQGHAGEVHRDDHQDDADQAE
jgi:hypothetical protein